MTSIIMHRGKKIEIESSEKAPQRKVKRCGTSAIANHGTSTVECARKVERIEREHKCLNSSVLSLGMVQNLK